MICYWLDITAFEVLFSLDIVLEVMPVPKVFRVDNRKNAVVFFVNGSRKALRLADPCCLKPFLGSCAFNLAAQPLG